MTISIKPGNPIIAGYPRGPLMSNIPGAFVWILLILLAVVISLPLGNLRTAVRPVPRPAPVQVQVEARIALVGQDENHRSLPFTVYVLAQQLSWKLESTDELQAEQTMLSPELIAVLQQAQDVFCVGTASSEGGTRVEEARAAQRAAKLAQWVGAALGNPTHTRLYALNAGQYKGPKDLASTYQRKAIILVTGPHDEKVNLSQGLRSGLEREQQASPVVYSLLHHYSNSKEWLNLMERSRTNSMPNPIASP